MSLRKLDGPDPDSSHTFSNRYGEVLIGRYSDPGKHIGVPDSFGAFPSPQVWEMIRVPDDEFDAKNYGRKYKLSRINASGTQGWEAGRFDRAALEGLRDLIDLTLREDDKNEQA